MAEQYIVTGPVAVVELEGGASRYLYKGTVLPEGCTNLDHLVSVGLVGKGGAAVAAGAPAETVAADAPAETVAADAPSLDGLNLDELRALAVERGIDLGGATRKDDVKAAIAAALA